jgi:hypothetical protein
LKFGEMTVGELLSSSRAILAELRRRGVIRTGNAAAGDYAELLVQRATAGELAPNSQKSWDVLTSNGERLQIKARVVTDPRKRGERQLSVFRSWDFDAAVVVLFDDEFRVWRQRACRSRPSRPPHSSSSTSVDTASSRQTTCSTAARTGLSDCEPRLVEKGTRRCPGSGCAIDVAICDLKKCGAGVAGGRTQGRRNGLVVGLTGVSDPARTPSHGRDPAGPPRRR